MAIFGFTRVQPSTAVKLDSKANKLRIEQEEQRDSATFLIAQARQAEAASQQAALRAEATERAFAVHVAAKAEVEKILTEAGVTL